MMLKRWLVLACACMMVLAMAGCTNTQQSDNGLTQAQAKTTTLYLPDEQGAFVVPTETEILIGEQGEAAALVAALIDHDVLPAEVAVNSFTQQDNVLTLDLNQAFADALSAVGSAGETMVMSSVADTFLAHYGGASLTITAEGETIETGHAVYDAPFTQIMDAAPAN